VNLAPNVRIKENFVPIGVESDSKLIDLHHYVLGLTQVPNRDERACLCTRVARKSVVPSRTSGGS
jgi:hypothetical protein